MFCPSCGTEERQTSQFCRACGVDMRTVRTALQRPDTITASAANAREDIGKAVAEKIKTFQTVKELDKFTEDVLPNIEKFLESPEERRLRRLRAGVVTAAVGLGITLTMILSKGIAFPPLVLFGWPGGIILFLIGIGVIINGLLFTLPKQDLPPPPHINSRNLLDQLTSNSTNTANTPAPLFNKEVKEIAPGYFAPPPSITEHTTRHLPEEQRSISPATQTGRITAEITDNK